MKNFFIVLEGFDASGKTETALALTELIKTKQYPVKLTFEPGGTLIGHKVRDLLIDNPDLNPQTKCRFLLVSRIEHYQKVIKPNLIKQTSKPLIIICDRYFYSTFAYQGFLEGLEPELIFKWHQQNGLFENLPDLVVYLNPEPKILIKRLQIKNATKEKKCHYEKNELNYIVNMLENYEKTFEFLATKKQTLNLKRIKTIKNPQEIAKQIWQWIIPILQKKNSSKSCYSLNNSKKCPPIFC